MVRLYGGADLYKDGAMRLVVMLASVAAVVGWAAPAQADPDQDAKFVAALNEAGITYQSGPDAAGIGRQARALMDQGNSESDVIKGMTQQNPGFTVDSATKFTQIAESAYCPQHTGGAGVAPPKTTPWNPPPMIPLPAPPAAP